MSLHPADHFRGCDVSVHSENKSDTYGILSLRGKKKLQAAATHADPSDKVNLERMRYFNGLAFVKGSSKSLANSFESLGVSEAMGVEGVEVRPPRRTWPSAQAAAAAAASCASSSSSSSSSSAAVAVATMGAGGPAPVMFASAPLGEILGMRSSEDGNLLFKPASAAAPRAAPPRTLDDPRQFPVLTASGFYVQPTPSPLRRRRVGAAAEPTAAVVARPGSVVVGIRALDDHLTFVGEGLTTRQDAVAQVGGGSGSVVSNTRREPTLAEQRAQWARSGAGVVAAATAASSSSISDISSSGVDAAALFSCNAGVAPTGKRHQVEQLKGVEMAGLLRPPPSTAPASVRDSYGVTFQPKPRIAPGEVAWEKVIPAEPKRRYLRGPPPEIAGLLSDPARATQIY